MNWLNLNVTTLDSEEFLGAEPVERATWLCLLRYCVGQENGGRITGAKLWKDRKWQQVVRVTSREVSAECDLWAWDGDDLMVAFYPLEKESEVQHLRSIGKLTSDAKKEASKSNGARGGRPKKNPTENPTGDDHETQRDKTQTNPTETHRKELERKGREIPPLPPDEETQPPCTIEQARSQAPMARMTPEEAEHWWHVRNASGWTKSSASGGAPRRITSWQSDMATSTAWVKESLAKSRNTNSAGKVKVSL